MRILSIDFGEKRIGLAMSDPLGFTAQGLPTLQNTGKNKSLQKICELCKENAIKTILIGIPVNMDGSHGPKAQEILKIVPVLEKNSGLPVITWDERLTSKQAERLMIEQGLSREKRRDDSDRIAATLILQNYLESIRK